MSYAGWGIQFVISIYLLPIWLAQNLNIDTNPALSDGPSTIWALYCERWSQTTNFVSTFVGCGHGITRSAIAVKGCTANGRGSLPRSDGPGKIALRHDPAMPRLRPRSTSQALHSLCHERARAEPVLVPIFTFGPNAIIPPLPTSTIFFFFTNCACQQHLI